MVVGHLGSGGTQRIMCFLADSWVQRGDRVAIATFDPTSSDFYSLDPRVTRHVLSANLREGQGRRSAITRNWTRILQLRKLVAQSNPDVLLAFITDANIRATLAAIGLPVNVVICERNDPSLQSHGFWWDAMRRVLYRAANTVTANSRGALKSLEAFVPQRKLAYVPNPLVGVSLHPVSARRDPAVAPLEILSIGRLTRQKGHDLLLRAYAGLDLGTSATLTIVGEGDLEDELRTLASELGVSKSVTWAGAVEDVGLYYRRASLFVLASRYEGMPNALLEALHVGLPVIVTDASPGLLELVTNGETGLVVPADDVAALAGAIKALVADRPLRERLGRAGQRVTEPYLPERALHEWDLVLGFDVRR